VATFYSGTPPEDIETDITNPLERFFTMASGMDHMESRSLLGVSIIKVFFQPGTNADVTQLSNLALVLLVIGATSFARMPGQTTTMKCGFRMENRDMITFSGGAPIVSCRPDTGGLQPPAASHASRLSGRYGRDRLHSGR
jgi:hypothetical protein